VPFPALLSLQTCILLRSCSAQNIVKSCTDSTIFYIPCEEHCGRAGEFSIVSFRQMKVACLFLCMFALTGLGSARPKTG